MGPLGRDAAGGCRRVRVSRVSIRSHLARASSCVLLAVHRHPCLVCCGGVHRVHNITLPTASPSLLSRRPLFPLPIHPQMSKRTKQQSADTDTDGESHRVTRSRAVDDVVAGAAGSQDSSSLSSSSSVASPTRSSLLSSLTSSAKQVSVVCRRCIDHTSPTTADVGSYGRGCLAR